MEGRVPASFSKAPSFSVGYMDRRVDPRKDFYRFAVGNWLRTHPLPADKSRYGSFSELDEWNVLQLKRIAEKCAAKGDSHPKDSAARLVGDFYRSAMDTERIEALGFGPVEDLWERADGVRSPGDVARVISLLHNEGVYPGFRSYSKADDRDSAHYSFYLEQGGLSLPDREYYLSKSFAKLRRQYREHILRMFVLKGVASSRGGERADAVLKIETALARASRTRTRLRDRDKNYNSLAPAELERKYPALAPLRYLRTAGVTTSRHVVVGQPEFFSKLDDLLAEGSLEEWRAYLCWSVLHSGAPFLHSAAEDENFDFFRRKLLGQKKQEPRWKRSVRVVDSMIGEALGELYVEEHFPEEARRRMSVLVGDLMQVFAERLGSVPWMSEETRRKALAKFATFKVNIGHPPTFRDYSSVGIDPQDYAGNVRRSESFEFHRLAKRVGGPVDHKEWLMTPPTVNAYFEETVNEMYFPAGILQPPFFDHTADDAVNYGAIGVVIGHEISHGYDDQGRKYDDRGNLKNWWTARDKRSFDAKAREVVRAYSAERILPGLHVNGRLTLGENIADLGGVSVAYEALQRRLAEDPSKGKKLEGLTPQQRFFVSHAQVWKEVIADMQSRRAATIDTHSPGKVRAVLPLVNHPGFDEAFPAAEGGESRTRIGVW